MDGRILLRRTDLARHLGVSPATILQWTKTGLMKPAERRIGGNMYDVEECRKRFTRIQELKLQKKRLSEIKEILDGEQK